MKKALQTAKTVFAIIGLLALGVLSGSFLSRKKSVSQNDEAEKAKEDKKNELESTPASDLVSAADNADRLRRAKDTISADFRERIRNRLKEELHRLSSPGADPDSGTGSGAGD